MAPSIYDKVMFQYPDFLIFRIYVFTNYRNSLWNCFRNFHSIFQLCQKCIKLGAGHLHCKSLEEIGFIVQIIVMN